MDKREIEMTKASSEIQKEEIARKIRELEKLGQKYAYVKRYVEFISEALTEIINEDTKRTIRDYVLSVITKPMQNKNQIRAVQTELGSLAEYLRRNRSEEQIKILVDWLKGAGQLRKSKKELLSILSKCTPDQSRMIIRNLERFRNNDAGLYRLISWAKISKTPGKALAEMISTLTEEDLQSMARIESLGKKVRFWPIYTKLVAIAEKDASTFSKIIRWISSDESIMNEKFNVIGSINVENADKTSLSKIPEVYDKDTVTKLFSTNKTVRLQLRTALRLMDNIEDTLKIVRKIIDKVEKEDRAWDIPKIIVDMLFILRIIPEEMWEGVIDNIIEDRRYTERMLENAAYNVKKFTSQKSQLNEKVLENLSKIAENTENKKELARVLSNIILWMSIGNIDGKRGVFKSRIYKLEKLDLEHLKKAFEKELKTK